MGEIDEDPIRVGKLALIQDVFEKDPVRPGGFFISSRADIDHAEEMTIEVTRILSIPGRIKNYLPDVSSRG